MLPEELSNDVCSLNPHTKKRTLSLIMRINSGGIVLETEIAESVIQSAVRYTYDGLFSDFQKGNFVNTTAEKSI